MCCCQIKCLTRHILILKQQQANFMFVSRVSPTGHVRMAWPRGSTVASFPPSLCVVCHHIATGSGSFLLDKAVCASILSTSTAASYLQQQDCTCCSTGYPTSPWGACPLCVARCRLPLSGVPAMQSDRSASSSAPHPIPCSMLPTHMPTCTTWLNNNLLHQTAYTAQLTNRDFQPSYRT